MKLYVSIDDTDNEESFGTGKMARMLAEELRDRGLITAPTITRHQFLVHPDIPYTSHNSSACIQGDGNAKDSMAIFECSAAFLASHFHTGSNPGLCVGREGHVAPELVTFGLRAQREVLTINEARSLAARLGVDLWWRGETGQGIIGALGGMGLRSTGNDGRFIGLDGIREITGTLTVGEIIRRTPIEKIIEENGKALGGGESIETLEWIRPVLREGAIVLVVLKEEGVWRTIEKAKRKKRPS
jgi:hypothetical protein